MLLLWDRIVGYDSLWLLPVTAAAILVYRSAALLACVDKAEAKDVLADATALKVVPLLQCFLYL